MKNFFNFLIMRIRTLLSCSGNGEKSNDDGVVGTNDSDSIENVDEILSDEDTENTGNMGDTGNTGTPEGMVAIPAGSFWMGSPKKELGRTSEETLHYVELTKGFYMDITEVTQKSFNSLMGYNPSKFSSCGDDCPVDQVSWHEALAYANARSKQEGLEECFDCTGSGRSGTCSLKTKFTKPQDCKGYRLPTESEWEYAARAGTSTAFYNGDITSGIGNEPNLNEIGWYDGNSGKTTHPVGGKFPNSFGLYDMSGNVYEWTMDGYGVYPAGTEASPLVDPTGLESGSHRVVRGGSWSNYAYFCRSAYRYGYTPTPSYYYLGFRLVRTK